MARRVLLYIFLICVIVMSFPVIAKAEAVSSLTIKELIVKHSVEMGLDPALALSIAKKESNFCHNRKSKYGAIGVFQLMPNTAKRMGYNPYSLNDNIKGGITYYQKMYKMFGSMELALAAYNAGPGNVKKYNGIPPFKETKNFVTTIINSYNSLKVNPDPVIAQYNSSVKDINVFAKYDFREQQDVILEAYLANQGI